MIRTTVYITPKQKLTIESLARRRHKPAAELIRELLDTGLDHAQTQDVAPATALLELLELGKRLDFHGPADLSTRHDDYLYGDKDEQ